MPEPSGVGPELFDDHYLHFYGDALAARADQDAELAARLLDLRRGDAVLDAPCGHGRIANLLAARGCRVVGIDNNARFLALAEADARRRGVEVEYRLGDLRELAFDARFDAALNWFTSFGYFDDDDNRRVLRGAYDALKPGGMLLIENNNVAQLLPRALPWLVYERDGDFMIDRWRFDPVTSRGVTERIVIRDGRTRRFEFFVRMLFPAELADWCRGVGFREIEFYDGEGAPLTAESRRMITIARK